jgi:hypothetical protein
MKPDENEKCVCGSGKKSKECCARPVLHKAEQITSTSGTNNVSSNKRECGTCTACCDGWLAGTVHGHEMKPGVPCHFMKNGACSIYSQRPQFPCREFVCAWVAPNSPFPEQFKPEHIGVIIVPIQWRGQFAYRLCSAGRDPDAAMLQWMASLSQRTGIPFFYEQEGQTSAFGSPAFQAELLESVQRNEPIW